MDTDHLQQMANRIGQFFEAMPDQDEAAREVAQHLRKFWAPAMRAALLAHVDVAGPAGLLPLVQCAVARHRDLLQGPSGH